MSNAVLVISPTDDYHALAIQALLKKRDCRVDIVDSATFPQNSTLVHKGANFRDVLINKIPLDSYHSIWWRRVGYPRPSSDIVHEEERQYALSEWRNALWGAFYASGV